MHGRANIIANKIPEGISVIDIQVFSSNGRLLARPTKRFIDDINALPFLDREKVKAVVSRQYGIPMKDITVSL